GGSAGGNAGGGGSGGGTTGACTPLTSVKFTTVNVAVDASSPLHTAQSDIDHDGHPDVVTVNYDSNSFSVLLGAANGTFVLADSSPASTCTAPNHVVTKDVTGDGLDDVIISCWDGTTAAVDVYVNQSAPGKVAFGAAQSVALPVGVAADFTPFVAKIDATSSPGLVLLGAQKLYASTNLGSGGFAAPRLVGAGLSSDTGVAGDLNGDGYDDFVTYSSSDDATQNGTDDLSMVISAPPAGYTITTIGYDSTGSSPGGTIYFGSTPLLQDIDGDGLLDIVIASGTSIPGQILFFKNSGTSTIPSFPNAGVEYDVGDIPVNVAMADFNCDGKLDVASASDGCEVQQSCSTNMDETPSLWIALGHASTFDPYETNSLPYGCLNMLVDDFNGDGYPDIVCGSDDKGINVLLNTP
ncbi:MAG TPA: VCBS repeat-containing protein, partial [Polyangia bacterium]|nr:VCBS repeat-containing protein [Polyangia bacterium]